MKILAEHILYRANEIGSPVTNLQIQKIMYFTLGFMIEDNRDIAKNLFEQGEMQAWLYGPVVPSIYSQYKVYKNRPIEDEGKLAKELNNQKVNHIIDVLIEVDPFKLVEISHKHEFWKKHEHEIRNCNMRPTYRFSDIEEAFNGA
ncbi:hypothetical protein B4W72_02280 [Staphylococcus delphini]|uniref:Antitoxin SocA-like Panacea domain-containing protein n=1 Tax=Staphylococcus delphini TaxID=53344 RepID=A0A2A4GW81_9STAP|nr:type II toxin-antitoxin system antitoxin SocA domain-containing protein [Staphylococcus delphini]PCF54568.1 hypothetical protein B5C08_08825 [Staphylococcus delphini]PCF61297.1 hypothetical protein B5C01_08220 [Staphylococcus delphini]PCF75660.1 hypothetical protein B4W72_02280 [Staphylococcus delphini]HEC2157131.1 DUF4065 domain-containing protein [Staphylococcus delphini]